MPGYGDNAEMQTYWTERGKTAPSSDADALNAARLVASEFLDNKYRAAFPGYKTVASRSQVREWPRTGAYDVYGYTIDSAEVPLEIRSAVYELAYLQIETPGVLQTNVVPGEMIKSASVDGAVSVEYAGAASASDMQISIPIVDSILAGILTGDGNSSSLTGYRNRV